MQELSGISIPVSTGRPHPSDGGERGEIERSGKHGGGQVRREVKEGDTDRVECDLPGAVGLGALLGKPAPGHDDGAGNVQHAKVEVHVRPPEGAQLPPAHPGERREHEERCKPWVPSSRFFDDLLDDFDARGGHSTVSDPWGFRLVGDVLPEPSPAHSLVEGSGEDGVVVSDGLRGRSGLGSARFS